jgi:DegV family protein with EDD domain
MAVAVVTDSAASLPSDLADELGITVVPLLLRVGNRELADGTLPLAELMALPAARVSTSGATPGGFAAGIEAAAARPGVDAVLVVTIARTMSATFDVARLTASELSTDAVPVRVVDSATAAGAEGLVAIHAARAAAGGGSLDAVESAARQAIGSVRLVATVDSLDRLIASGRVSAIAGRAGRLVNVNPLFEFRDGAVHPIRPAFTRDAALDRIVQRWRRTREPGAALHVAGMHALDSDAADHLLKRVVDEVEPAEAFVGAFSSVMVAHTGGGLVGLAWWWERGESDQAGTGADASTHSTDSTMGATAGASKA